MRTRAPIPSRLDFVPTSRRSIQCCGCGLVFSDPLTLIAPSGGTVSVDTPVVLAPAYGAAMDVADALARKGLGLRGHRSIITAAAAFRAAGVPVPLIARFARKVGRDEVLLWPPEAREASLLGVLPSPTFAFVSGFSVDPATRARMRADAGIPLSNQSGHPDLLAYLETTGAREVAVTRGFSESFAEDLRGRGYDAYAVGPPRQMELFRG